MTENIRFGCAPIAWTNDDLPELGKQNTFEQCMKGQKLVTSILK